MLTLIIMGIILAMIVLFGFIANLILPILVPTAQEANSLLQGAVQSTGDSGLQNAAASSFDPAARSLSNLEWMSYTFLILMFIVFLIMCFYVKVYPFLIIIWIVMIIILVITSIYLTVAYQDIRTDPGVGSYYTAWGNTDFALQNLPILMFIEGLIGGIIMFMLSSKDPQTETGGGGPL